MTDTTSPEATSSNGADRDDASQPGAPAAAGAAMGVRPPIPTYAQGLMRIRVPVRVTLASQRKSVREITELGPGSIIMFDKTCDEPLTLTAGDCPLAIGEVVKVGDKFGLRISELVR